MADNNRQSTDDTSAEGATPPGRGQTNHDTMRESATRTISGPGASDFLAASGGLDIPGIDPGKGTSALRGDSPLTDPRNLTPQFGSDDERIPGERDPSTRSERATGAGDPNNIPGSQTGTIGGGGFGAHNPSANRATGMDDATTEEREREGGGAPRERRRQE